jgi:putative aminopeptidase FrvX
LEDLSVLFRNNRKKALIESKGVDRRTGCCSLLQLAVVLLCEVVPTAEASRIFGVHEETGVDAASWEKVPNHYS